jgi:putative acetyltransferase
MDSPESRPQLLIRCASNPDDIGIVRRLFQEYATELGVDLRFQGFSEELAGLPGPYAPPPGRLLLAFSGETVAGCVALRPLKSAVCEMKRMYVRPPFRQAGVGRRLAEQLLLEARQAGYRSMVLDTLAHMAAALRLYESLGFHRCPAYYENPLPDAVYLERLL